MTTSRRDFLKTAGVAAGALSLSSLPSWINDVTAAEEAAANGVWVHRYFQTLVAGKVIDKY